MMKHILLVLSLMIWTVSAGAAIGYDVVDVKNGSVIKGTVTFKGSVPEDEKIVIDANTEYCGSEQQAGKYIVSDSRVKNVVVWIEGVERGKAVTAEPVNVTIKNCRTVPHVNIGFVGGEFVFRNDDDILHTVQSKLGLAYQKQASSRPLEDGASIYNLALPQKGLEIKKPIKKWHRYTDETGFIQVRSNTHNWIRGYIFIFDNPYAAVTDEKGTFVIGDLPPGEYVLKVWHEGFGTKEEKIKVASGATKEVSIAFSN